MASMSVADAVAQALKGVIAYGNQNGNTVVTMNNSPIMIFNAVVDMSQTVATTVATAAAASGRLPAAAAPAARVEPSPAARKADAEDAGEDEGGIEGVAALANQNMNTIVTMNNSPILIFNAVVDMDQTVATVVATALAAKVE